MPDRTVYDNPLISRYASKAMAELWGPQRKFRTWRRLWLALAEAEAELGLLADDGKSPRIRPEQLAELRAHLDDIDFAGPPSYEQRLRHDVMAHVHALGDVGPGGPDIIHLGATSCYVTDNADLILMREGLGDWSATSSSAVIDALADVRRALEGRADARASPTSSRPSSSTVGKRATLWCYDLVLDLHELERRLATS